MEKIKIEVCKDNFKVAMGKWSVIFGRACKFGSEYAMDIIRYVINYYGNNRKVVFNEPMTDIPDGLKGYCIDTVTAISVKDRIFFLHDSEGKPHDVSFTFKDKETTQAIMDKVLDSVAE